jgi:hypothetical protein
LAQYKNEARDVIGIRTYSSLLVSSPIISGELGEHILPFLRLLIFQSLI